MYKTRLCTLCIIIFVYLIGVIVLSTVSIHDSRKVGYNAAGRSRAMEMSGSALARPKYHIQWCRPLHYIERPEGRPIIGHNSHLTETRKWTTHPQTAWQTVGTSVAEKVADLCLSCLIYIQLTSVAMSRKVGRELGMTRM
ncbi:uncharacterized protein LOC113467457 [Diaphorina citri]|uniref:Uncharacterized protein LOC113467457 n=1 Tax=Diaphorina citri TaxID=121845 RepID=A0A3Q0IXN7_DIACI|nr:uncharacterized protein LOC113467457 [Diaphorina citri]